MAVSSLQDMETLFEGIPLDEVSTSMTINSPAAMLLAFYVLVAEKQGVAPAKLTGTVQADILKEFIAQKEYIFPPRPSMRIIVDMVRYCTEKLPKWNSISISGYHIREAGSTAAQELAFTLRDGIEYVQWCVDAGMDVDSFAPRLSFFFNSPLRLLRGDRQVPGGAAHLGAHHEGPLRRQEPALLDAALPHPDRGGEPHRPAALQQRGAHRPPGPGRGARAAPSRCTRTPSTRPWPCPPRRR